MVIFEHYLMTTKLSKYKCIPDLNENSSVLEASITSSQGSPSGVGPRPAESGGIVGDYEYTNALLYISSHFVTLAPFMIDREI